ncbi:MAG: mechanosensitive ion channel family protein [Lachnospiraceae bacterium]|jgi:small conductance mechanosensitive channel
MSTSTSDAAEELANTWSEDIRNFFLNTGGSLSQWAITLAGKIILALVVWWIGRKLIRYIADTMLPKFLRKTKADPDVDKFAVSATRIVLYILLFLEILSILGINTTSFVTLLGSAALAIGLGLQGALSNLAGGVLLLIFKPFRKGDMIKVEDLTGTVDSIGILYTKLITYDDVSINLPNGNLMNSNILNLTDQGIRRLDVDMSVPYSVNLKRVRDIFLAVMESEEKIRKDAPMEVVLKEFDDSAVILQSHCTVASSDYYEMLWKLQERYKEELDKAGISIPFPQVDVHVQNQTPQT